MWNNKDVKSYAKDFLRKHYWKAFIVCLIVSLVSSGGSSGNNSSNNGYNNDVQYNNEQDIFDQFENNEVVKKVSPMFNFATNRGLTPFSLIGMGMISTITIVFAILLITVGYALEVGRSRFFLRGFEGDADISEMFSVFNSREYVSIIKTQFLRSLYIFLWTLLFVIPGIIKSYEYRFVPYILAEEPNISSKEAMELSKSITDGHKLNIWGLDLSFFGWYILGALALGVGVFFVDPYHEAANARLYNILSGNDRLHDDKSLYNEYDF